MEYRPPPPPPPIPMAGDLRRVALQSVGGGDEGATGLLSRTSGYSARSEGPYRGQSSQIHSVTHGGQSTDFNARSSNDPFAQRSVERPLRGHASERGAVGSLSHATFDEPVGATARHAALSDDERITSQLLSLVNETPQSYRRKTAGKVPLTEKHLCSLVDDLQNYAREQPTALPSAHAPEYRPLSYYDNNCSATDDNNNYNRTNVHTSSMTTVSQSQLSSKPTVSPMQSAPNRGAPQIMLTPATPLTKTAPISQFSPPLPPPPLQRTHAVNSTAAAKFDPQSFCRDLLDDPLNAPTPPRRTNDSIDDVLKLLHSTTVDTRGDRSLARSPNQSYSETTPNTGYSRHSTSKVTTSQSSPHFTSTQYSGSTSPRFPTNSLKRVTINEEQSTVHGPSSGTIYPSASLPSFGRRHHEESAGHLPSPQYGKRHVCAECAAVINVDKPGCTALSQTWHIDCFTCVVCRVKLAGGSFYAVEGRPYCEKDYVDTLEKCATCEKPIMERILRASGKPYHPACFQCTVCNKCLDGVPFTADQQGEVHCVPCFHEKYAPRCAGCTKPITPEEGKEESYRVVAMDNSYHVECYKCEDCGLKLSSKIEGHGCYPLDKTLLCKDCNTARVRKLTA